MATTAIPNRGYWDDTSTWDDTLTWADSPWADDISALIEQTIAKSAVGSLMEIEQSINLKLAGSGSLASLTQTVKRTSSGSVLNIEQRVRSGVPLPSFAWELALTIGGVQIPEDRILGQIEVTREENSSALMTVTIRPPLGAQDLSFYEGKLVTLDVYKGGATERVYRGKINVPECDLLAGTITLKCSNILSEETNKAGFRYSYNGRYLQTSDLGYWSTDVFGEPKDQADEVEKRLETVEASLDFAPNGTIYLTDWEPKVTPDYILTNSSVYRRNPRVEIASRARVINKVRINLEYQYQRLRHRERQYSFEMGNPKRDNRNPSFSWRPCDTAAWNIVPPTIEVIRAAVEAAGGMYKITSNFDEYYAGVYNCAGSTNCLTDYNVISNYVVQRPDDTELATRTYWTMAKRFTQNISESATIELSCPQSIAQYGEVLQEYTHGVRADFDDDEWEGQETWSEAPSNFTQAANGDYVLDYDSPAGSGVGAQWGAIFTCSVNRAVAKMRNSHRSNRVYVETDLMPQLDLRHTLQVNTNRVQAQGKVYAIRHIFDISERDAYTEIEIALSKAKGSPPAGFTLNSKEIRPAIPNPSGGVSSTIKLGTYLSKYGKEPDPSWAGFILQEYEFEPYKVNFNPFASNVQNCWQYNISGRAFVVDFPEIEAEARDDIEAESTTLRDVGIRDDLLTVTFVDG